MEQPLRQAYKQVGVTERDIAIENVHLIRSTNAVEISCTLAAPLPEERLRSFEDAVSALMPRYNPTFTYAVRPAEEAPAPAPAPAPQPAAPTAAPVPPTAAVVVKKTNVIEVDLPENGILLGGRIPSGRHTAIHDLTEGEKTCIIGGRLVSATLREGWGNKSEKGKSSWRVQMNVTDFTDSIYCEATFFEEWKALRFMFWLETARKKGKDFLLRGVCRSRKYNPELNFYINDCSIVDRVLRELFYLPCYPLHMLPPDAVMARFVHRGQMPGFKCHTTRLLFHRFFHQFPVGVFHALGGDNFNISAELKDPREKRGADGYLGGNGKMAVIHPL